MSRTWRKWLKEGHRHPPTSNCIHNILSCFEYSCICNVQGKYWFHRRTITLGLFFWPSFGATNCNLAKKPQGGAQTIHNSQCKLCHVRHIITDSGASKRLYFLLQQKNTLIPIDGEINAKRSNQNQILTLISFFYDLNVSYYTKTFLCRMTILSLIIMAKQLRQNAGVFESNRCGGGRAKSVLTRVAPFLFYSNQVHISILWTN